MLDFDGTLSNIAKTPARARLPKSNERILQVLARYVPIAIVSGRSLNDIKRKIGIKGIVYAGNHGLEWEIKNKKGAVKIPSGQTLTIAKAHAQLCKLVESYHGSLLENKSLSLSLHYRLLKKKFVKKFLSDAWQILSPFLKKRLLKISHGKKVVEVRPALLWDKGRMVNFLRKKLGFSLVPIYIGDDATDEDAFKALRTGITIKNGQNQNSQAVYFCHSAKQINLFLRWLLKELK